MLEPTYTRFAAAIPMIDPILKLDGAIVWFPHYKAALHEPISEERKVFLKQRSSRPMCCVGKPNYLPPVCCIVGKSQVGYHAGPHKAHLKAFICDVRNLLPGTLQQPYHNFLFIRHMKHQGFNTSDWRSVSICPVYLG